MPLDLSGIDLKQNQEQPAKLDLSGTGADTLDLSGIDTGQTPTAPQTAPVAPQAPQISTQPEPSVVEDMAKQAYAGAIKGFSNLAETVNNALNYLVVDPYYATKHQLGFDTQDQALKRFTSNQGLERIKEALPKPQTTAGAVTGMVTQIALPMSKITKTVDAIGMANATIRGLITGGITDMSVFDKNDGNLNTMLANSPDPELHKWANKYLVIGPDDSKTTAGLKQAVEGLFGGGVAESIFKMFKVAKAGMVAKSQVGKITKLQPAFNEARARYMEQYGLNPQEATKRAMDITGLNKLNFIPEKIAKPAEMTQDELFANAKEMGIDPEDYKKLIPKQDQIQEDLISPDPGKVEKIPAMTAKLHKEVKAARIKNVVRMSNQDALAQAAKAGMDVNKYITQPTKQEDLFANFGTLEQKPSKSTAAKPKGEAVPTPVGEQSFLPLDVSPQQQIPFPGMQPVTKSDVAIPGIPSTKGRQAELTGAHVPGQAPTDAAQQINMMLQGGPIVDRKALNTDLIKSIHNETIPTITTDTVNQIKQQNSLMFSAAKPEYDINKLSTDMESLLRQQMTNNTQRTERVGKLVAEDITKRNALGSKEGYLQSLPSRTVLGVRETIRAINDRSGEYLGRWENRNHLRSAAAQQAVDAFEKGVKKLSKADQSELDRLWKTGGIDEVQKFVDNRPTIAGGFEEVKTMLAHMANEGKPLGALDDIQTLAGYLPRNVRDFKGYMKATGGEVQRGINEALTKAQAAAGGRALTEWEKADVINKAIRNRPIKAGQVGKASHMQERQWGSVPHYLQPFYDGAIASLRHYASTMSENIGKRELLGYTTKGDGLDSPETIATLLRNGGGEGGGIGKVLQEELDAGNISKGDMHSISSLIQSRVGSGTVPPKRWVQNMKNFMYLGTLINPYSILKQSTDAALGAYVNGLSNAVYGVARSLVPGGVKMEDIGLRHIVQDMAGSGVRSQEWLNNALKWSQFTRIDTLGKTSVLNGSLRKFRRLAGTPKGQDAIKAQYRNTFNEAELDQLIGDLKTGVLSNDVKYLLWNDLAKLQPISLSEMPAAYLDHPNGRWLYSLKTFTLKGLNRIYFDGINEMRKGNVTKGTKNLMLYGGLLIASGASMDSVNDLLQGRNQMSIPDRVLANALAIIGTNDYVVHQLHKGKLQDAVISSYVPPVFPFAQAAYKDAADMWNGKVKSLAAWNSMNYVPGVGRVIHNFWGGGAEKHNAMLAKQQGRAY